MRVSLLCCLLVCLLSGQVRAEQDALRVYPEQPRKDGALLLLIVDEWSNGCGGEIRTTVTADLIEIAALPSQAELCTQVVTPFFDLIDPRERAGADADFADEVTVNYLFDGELRASRTIRFGSESGPAERFQTGSWTNATLANHGLFIDQQGDVLTAALLDYDADGKATWYYAAGKVEGQVFSADMVRYGEIVCVTAPCPRAAPVRQGRVNLLWFDSDVLIAGFSGVLESGLGQVFNQHVYQRLDLYRSPELPQPSPGELPLPDLIGNWLGGVQGDGARADDFRALVVKYGGLDLSGATDAHYFDVYPGAGAGGDPGQVEFRIRCAGGVSGTAECSLENYRSSGADCAASFAYSAVGVDRVRTSVQCSSDTLSFNSLFQLFRLD